MYVTNWETTHLGHIMELEWRLKVFPSSIFILFWISLHQGTPSCSLFLKLRCCMLSHMNEVDLFIFRYVFLYKIQNCIFPCVFSTFTSQARSRLSLGRHVETFSLQRQIFVYDMLLMKSLVKLVAWQARLWVTCFGTVTKRKKPGNRPVSLLTEMISYIGSLWTLSGISSLSNILAPICLSTHSQLHGACGLTRTKPEWVLLDNLPMRSSPKPFIF